MKEGNDVQDQISNVRVAVISCPLEVPIHFGDWVMDHRDFALVRIDSEEGHSGYAYCLTRDGPVEAIVRRTIAPFYIGGSVDDPESLFYKALWSNHAVHASGIGMRALSIVDIAAWDLAAKAAGMSITSYLGGERHPMPATAIVGYPPSMSPSETAQQVTDLHNEGWTRFKLPIAPTPDESVARLAASREAAPEAWIGFDANMVFRSSVEAIEFETRLRDLDLGWFEDVVPPGDAAMVAAIREGSETPIAMGDEQGGSYHPQALLHHDAVDVIRLDATTNGGVTRLRAILEDVTSKGVAFAPHMFPHFHSRLLSALGYPDAPIEWGIPGTGVHPMDDPLTQPIVENGRMQPLPDDPGFGQLTNLDWLRDQEIDDPDGLVDDL